MDIHEATRIQNELSPGQAERERLDIDESIHDFEQSDGYHVCDDGEDHYSTDCPMFTEGDK